MTTIVIARYKLNDAKAVAMKIAKAYPPALTVEGNSTVIDDIVNAGFNVNSIVMEYTKINSISRLGSTIAGLEMNAVIDNSPTIICYMTNDQWAEIEADENWVLI
jgi:hypothetical protein